MRGRHVDPIERLIGGMEVTKTGCWIPARKPTRKGYVRAYDYSVQPMKAVYAHRLSYEHFIGPVPEGLQLDHLCRVRACINPDHLEPVTCRDNVRRGENNAAHNARKTHCIHGHPFIGDNLLMDCYGRRVCRICRKVTQAKVRAKRKALAWEAFG